MAVKKGKAPTRSTDVVPREYASQEGSDPVLAPSELSAAQIAQRRRDRARAEAAGVLGPLRPEQLDIARDVDVEADEDERRKRKAWEKKKREMAREKAARMARKGKVPPIAGHLEQVIQDIFSEADEREPQSDLEYMMSLQGDRRDAALAKDWENPDAETQDWISEKMAAKSPAELRKWLEEYGGQVPEWVRLEAENILEDEPLSPMEEFANRQADWDEVSDLYRARQEAAEYPPHSSEITQQVTGDAREEVERDFMEEYPDLEDTALAVGSADDNAPRFAAQIDTATDIKEQTFPNGQTGISFTDNSGRKRRWVYDGNDDTLIEM